MKKWSDHPLNIQSAEMLVCTVWIVDTKRWGRCQLSIKELVCWMWQMIGCLSGEDPPAGPSWGIKAAIWTPLLGWWVEIWTRANPLGPLQLCPPLSVKKSSNDAFYIANMMQLNIEYVERRQAANRASPGPLNCRDVGTSACQKDQDNCFHSGDSWIIFFWTLNTQLFDCLKLCNLSPSQSPWAWFCLTLLPV